MLRGNFMKKKMNQWKEKILRKMKRFKEEKQWKQFFKENALFTVFVITCLINAILLRFFTMPTLENYL